MYAWTGSERTNSNERFTKRVNSVRKRTSSVIERDSSENLRTSSVQKLKQTVN